MALARPTASVCPLVPGGLEERTEDRGDFRVEVYVRSERRLDLETGVTDQRIRR